MLRTNGPLAHRAGPLFGALLVVVGMLVAVSPVVPGVRALDPTPDPSGATSPDPGPTPTVAPDPTPDPAVTPDPGITPDPGDHARPRRHARAIPNGHGDTRPVC